MSTGTTGHPEPGAELGPFRLGKRLGVGGMGIVFQALDTQLNRQVALKVITPHIGDDPEFRARFTREAQAQASLDSPHVVQVYSFGEADGQLYIASQLIPDGDLGQMLTKHGRPPARIAANLMSQVADGLADAHAAGLIHRDIKPANVLLRNRDHQLHAYLGDFGIARQVGQTQLTQVGSAVGTPSYMAPELHLGHEAGTASDIYSLGCLLWATLSGTPPYVGSTDYQVVMAHVEQPVPQLAPTGPLAAELNRVLLAAMAKDPGQRYPTAAAMRDDLKRVVRLPDDPSPVRPADATPGPEPSPQPWSVAHAQTPTPTPMPGPVSQAPPAPPFRTPTPQPASFSSAPTGNYHQQHQPTAGRHSGGGGRKTGWIIAAVLVLVLAIGGIVAAVLLANGDDGAGGSEGGSGDGGGAREAQAVESIKAEFLTSDGVTDESATCIAEKLVEEVGVDTLVSGGLLTEDLEYNAGGTETGETGETGETDAAADSLAVFAGVTSATTHCIKQLGVAPSSLPAP